MADYRTTLSANTTGTKIAQVKKPRDLDMFFATISATGTFGSGTLSYSLSVDNGATLTQMKDLSGVAYSTTAADVVNVNLGVPNHNQAASQVAIYAVLSGATNPTITITVMDNIGGAG